MRALILLMALVASIAEAQTPTPACVTYYNGQASGYYAIGRATKAVGPCTGTYTRYAGNPVFSGSGVNGSFDQVLVYQPSIVTEGPYTYLFYQGDSATDVRSIGRVRSTDGGLTFSNATRTAVLTPSGGWEGSYVFYPTVYSDPTDPDPNQRCKLWYGGLNGGIAQTGYAYAPSCGGVFTKYGPPVVTLGAGGAWDDSITVLGSVFRNGGTWYGYYVGAPATNGNVSQAGLVTFTDPKSVYTKPFPNPILRVRSTANQLLSSNWVVGTSTVTVATPGVFNPGEIVFVVDRIGRQFNRVVSVGANTVQLRDIATRTFNTSDAASLRSVFWNAVLPSAVWFDGNYHMSVVGYIIAGDLGQLLEWVGYATAPSFDAGTWSYDFSAGAYLEPPAGGWDLNSSENMRFLGTPANISAPTNTPLPTATPTPTVQFCPTCTPPAGSPVNAMGSCPGGYACCL